MTKDEKIALQQRVFDVRAKVSDWEFGRLINPVPGDNGFSEKTKDYHVKLNAVRQLMSCPDGGTPSFILAGLMSTLEALDGAATIATPESVALAKSTLNEAKDVYSELVDKLEMNEDEELDEDDVGGPSDGDADNGVMGDPLGSFPAVASPY